MPRQQLIKFRRGSGVPSAAAFDTAEPAWDGSNGRLYVKNDAGAMVPVNGLSTPSAAAVSVVNTTAETSILTYSLPTSPAIGTIFQFNIWGSYLNNSGGNRTVRLLFKLGATTMFDTGTSGNLGASATRRRFAIEGALGIDGASTQVVNCYGRLGPTAAWGAPTVEFFGDGIAAESLATTKNLTVTVIHSSAATTVSLDVEMSNVDRITP